MNIRDILKLAADLLGMADVANEIMRFSGTPSGEIEAFLRCYHLVESEIALDYLPLIRKDAMKAEDGKLHFADFPEEPVDIRKVTAGGLKVRFTLYEGYLELPAGTTDVEVTYAYAPKKRLISDKSVFTGKVTERILGYGVASEYCFAACRYDESKMWGERYREALRSAGLLRRTLSVRSRRWV